MTTNSNRIETISNCQLEWHKERGVLYVHNRDTGMTVFRICNLKPPLFPKHSLNDEMLDITVGVTQGRLNFEIKEKRKEYEQIAKPPLDRIESPGPSSPDSKPKRSPASSRIRKTR